MRLPRFSLVSVVMSIVFSFLFGAIPLWAGTIDKDFSPTGYSLTDTEKPFYIADKTAVLAAIPAEKKSIETIFDQHYRQSINRTCSDLKVKYSSVDVRSSLLTVAFRSGNDRVDKNLTHTHFNAGLANNGWHDQLAEYKDRPGWKPV